MLVAISMLVSFFEITAIGTMNEIITSTVGAEMKTATDETKVGRAFLWWVLYGEKYAAKPQRRKASCPTSRPADYNSPEEANARREVSLDSFRQLVQQLEQEQEV